MGPEKLSHFPEVPELRHGRFRARSARLTVRLAPFTAAALPLCILRDVVVSDSLLGEPQGYHFKPHAGFRECVTSQRRLSFPSPDPL